MAHHDPNDPSGEKYSQPVEYRHQDGPQHAPDGGHGGRNALIVIGLLGVIGAGLFVANEESHHSSGGRASAESSPGSHEPSTSISVPSTHRANSASSTAKASPSKSRTSSSAPSRPTSRPTTHATSVPSHNPVTPTSVPSHENLRLEVARTIVLGFDAQKTSLDDMVQDLRATHAGGAFLVDVDNSSGQGNELYRGIHNALPDVMLMSDEEGGNVHRLTYPFSPPSAQQLGAMTVAQVRQWGMREGAVMRQNGVRWDLAPVLDVDDGSGTGAISALDRSFGQPGQSYAAQSANIAAKADAFAKGLEAEGVEDVAKHFPGIGHALPNSDTDSHAAHTTVTNSDLRPYATLAANGDLGGVMMSNVFADNWDSSRPADISPAAYRKLDGIVGSNVLELTDDLTAISNYYGLPPAESVAAAKVAGADMPLVDYTSIGDFERAVDITVSEEPVAQIHESYEKYLALK